MSAIQEPDLMGSGDPERAFVDTLDSLDTHGWLLRACVVLSLASAIGMAATSGYISLKAMHPMPSGDHWATVLEYRDWLAGEMGVTDLVRRHNEHRLLFPRLFFLVDYHAFRGSLSFLIASIYAITIAHGLLLAAIARRYAGRPGPWIAITTGITSSFVVSGAQTQNLNWAFQIPFVLVYLAATASFYLLAEAVRANREGEPGAWPRLVGALAAGVVATYSMVNGLLVWPILVTLALVYRVPWRQATCVAVSAVVICASYLAGYADSGRSHRTELVTDWGDVLHFFLLLLGGPIAQVRSPSPVAGAAYQPLLPGGAILPATVLGGLLLTLVLVVTYRFFRTRPVNPLVLTSIGILGFTVGTMVMVAVGRGGLGGGVDYAFQSRYATPALLAWSALVLLGLSWWPVPSLGRRGVIAASLPLTGLVLLLWVKQLPELSYADGRLAYLNRLQQELVDGGLDGRMVSQLNRGNPGITLPAVHFLATHRMGVYADAAAHLADRGIRLRGTDLWLDVAGNWGLGPASIYSSPAGLPTDEWEILGSRVEGDHSVGRIEIAGLRPDDTGALPVRVVTGPVPDGQSLELIDARDGSLVDRVDLSRPIGEWIDLGLVVPEDLPPDAILLVGRDEGQGWGQWLGLGVHRPPR